MSSASIDCRVQPRLRNPSNATREPGISAFNYFIFSYEGNSISKLAKDDITIFNKNILKYRILNVSILGSQLLVLGASDRVE